MQGMWRMRETLSAKYKNTTGIKKGQKKVRKPYISMHQQYRKAFISLSIRKD